MKTLYDYFVEEKLTPIYAGEGSRKLCFIYNKASEKTFCCHPMRVEQTGEATISFSFDTSIKTEVLKEKVAPEETISFFLCNCEACRKSRRALVAWGYHNKKLLLGYKEEVGEVVAYLSNDENGNWFHFYYKSFKTVEEVKKHYTDDKIIDIIFDHIEANDDDERVYVYGNLYESREEERFKYIGLFTTGDQNAIIYQVDSVLQAWVTPKDLSGYSKEQVIEYLNDPDNDEIGWSVTADSMGELMEQLM